MESAQNKMNNSSSCSNIDEKVNDRRDTAANDSTKYKGDLREIKNQGDMRDITDTGGNFRNKLTNS
ncbi:MAG TPA: hypothetical protein VN381_04510 [Anaerovoracaceae bacterium]|nr:hypothetical protein [Anaerovoracaceae bacterium]